MIRFAYEEAETVLDEFAAAPDRYAAYRRAWRKFKFMLACYAFVDFSDDSDRGVGALRRKILTEAALTAAWEDAQMAFTGQGDSALTGAVIGLWSALRPEEHDLFFKVVKEAFKRAEEATSPEVVRRYMSRFRLQPPRRPEQGFNLSVVLPTGGPSLRDWAADEGQDPDEIEEQWYWLAVGDRNLVNERRGGGGGGEGKGGGGGRRKARLKLVD